MFSTRSSDDWEKTDVLLEDADEGSSHGSTPNKVVLKLWGQFNSKVQEFQDNVGGLVEINRCELDIYRNPRTTETKRSLNTTELTTIEVSSNYFIFVIKKVLVPKFLAN